MRDELKRVVERWQQLPLDRALSHAPAVSKVMQALADEVAAGRIPGVAFVPDLGPATLMHQLQVMVYDLFEAQPGHDRASVIERLTGIRRTL